MYSPAEITACILHKKIYLFPAASSRVSLCVLSPECLLVSSMCCHGDMLLNDTWEMDEETIQTHRGSQERARLYRPARTKPDHHTHDTIIPIIDKTLSAEMRCITGLCQRALITRNIRVTNISVDAHGSDAQFQRNLCPSEWSAQKCGERSWVLTMTGNNTWSMTTS